jgi:sporulation protein YqfD
MDMLTKFGVTVYQGQDVDEVTILFSVRRGDLAAARWVARKLGDKLDIVEKRGWYWRVAALRKRPVLMVGVAVLIALTLLLPTRVLFFRVEGNDYVPANRILEAAERCGIEFGANRREVRSEKMKNRLLEEVPQLQWAGVNTYGCVAVISVREKPLETEKNSDPAIHSIVAARDGFILSATATSGNLLCAPGQTVKEGQILISPYLDCGICLRLEDAEGEIMASTRHEIMAVTPVERVKKGAVRVEQVRFSLLVGKKRINLWKDSGIWDGSCGRMYEEYYITLPGGFRLPFGIAKETVTSYEMTAVEAEPEPTKRMLIGFSEERMLANMVAGQIQKSKTDFERRGGIYVLSGHYRCTEMIGRARKEQIGDTNG